MGNHSSSPNKLRKAASTAFGTNTVTGDKLQLSGHKRTKSGSWGKHSFSFLYLNDLFASQTNPATLANAIDSFIQRGGSRPCHHLQLHPRTRTCLLSAFAYLVSAKEPACFLLTSNLTIRG